MYYRVNGAKGYIKFDWKTAREMIRQIIEAGDACYDCPKRTFSLSI